MERAPAGMLHFADRPGEPGHDGGNCYGPAVASVATLPCWPPTFIWTTGIARRRTIARVLIAERQRRERPAAANHRMP